jgi:hypothetical protein
LCWGARILDVESTPFVLVMRKMYMRRIYPNVEGIRNSIRVLTLTNEKFGRLKAEDLVDHRIVRKLEKGGLV